MRKSDPAFAALPVHEQYERAGGIEGVVVHGDLELEIVLSAPIAQILYWFAMPFTTPMPWEAVAYYDGKEGRPNFADQAVGTGPFRLTLYQKQHRFVLERNSAWYGSSAGRRECARAPSFRSEIDREDIETGRIDPAYAGRRLPFLDRILFTREQREHSRASTSSCRATTTTAASSRRASMRSSSTGSCRREMEARGMRLDKEVEPTIFYIGFNMDDAIVGAPAGDKGRKLRQAMSLVIDCRASSCACSSTAAACRRNRRCRRASSATARTTGTPSASPTWRAHASCSPRPATRTASIPRPRQPLKLNFDTGNTVGGGAAAVRVLRRGLARARPRRGDQGHHLQSVPAEGAPGRLPDFHLGLDCGLPGPGELPVPARVRERPVEEQGAEHGEFLQCGVTTSSTAR